MFSNGWDFWNDNGTTPLLGQNPCLTWVQDSGAISTEFELTTVV